MDVSIIVCTRDRAPSLQGTLQSITATAVPHGCLVECVVVDNGSTDATRDVVHSFASAAIPVRYFHEPTSGKSHALNRALREAKGWVLVWTDDDVRVPSDWLDGMAVPILEGRADAVAGAIAIPEELLRRIAGTPLETRLGWVACTEGAELSNPKLMIGANMSISRAVADAIPAYDTRLGPGPDSLGFGEEIVYSMQAVAAGFRLVGAPACAVMHHFDVTRIDQPALERLAARMGASWAYVCWHCAGLTASGTVRRVIRMAAIRTRLLTVKALFQGWMSWRAERRQAERRMTGQRLENELRVLDAYWRSFLASYLRESRSFPRHGLTGAGVARGRARSPAVAP